MSFSSVSTDIKAWVQFNGVGTVSIRGSFNVSSITDGGVGIYTVNFTTAMPDANYVILTASGTGTATNPVGFHYGSPATGSVNVFSFQGANSSFDQSLCSVGIFR